MRFAIRILISLSSTTSIFFPINEAGASADLTGLVFCVALLN
ncbi:hypothetical protein N824_13895 [Pedobacter sp. V48]|nr:hypothetical protein N824_13895 [Pedobacter sp. V48]